jgi:hypothetical protein
VQRVRRGVRRRAARCGARRAHRKARGNRGDHRHGGLRLLLWEDCAIGAPHHGALEERIRDERGVDVAVPHGALVVLVDAQRVVVDGLARDVEDFADKDVEGSESNCEQYSRKM